MVDGKLYPDEVDKKIFYELSKLKKPICLAINKVDSKKDELRANEFLSFGAKKVFWLSVSHNCGTDELRAWIYQHLEPNQNEKIEQDFDEYLQSLDENGHYLNQNQLNDFEYGEVKH